MSVKMEKIEKNSVELEVTVDAKVFSAAVNKAAKALASKVNVPGFRKGKAPRIMVERHVGTAALYNDAADDILGAEYMKAVDEAGIEPVDRPEIELVQIEDGQDLIFKAKVTVKPEVELGSYQGLEVEKTAAMVTDEEVEQDLVRKQDQHAKILNLEEGSVQDKDNTNIDFSGSVDGVLFDGGTAEGYDLVIGSGSFIPGFEEQLIGAQIGQEVDVNVRFPDEYHVEDLKGKEALFKVKVNRIKRKEIAALDDEFAKDISEFETLDELKADLRDKLMKAAEQRAEAEYKNAVVAKAVDHASVEIPTAMIDNRIGMMLEDMAQNLSYQGLDLETYCQYTGTSMDSLKENIRPQASENVKTELVLEAIAKAEGIEVTEEELNSELAKLAERYQTSPENLKQALMARGEIGMYRQSLVSEKTVNFLVEQA
ncbi:trigger factor [Desulfitobacterium dichloroeliminans LMG P-21439]|uniref:Trigger factor n=1 Tax=Desulfitobacterium dichloroeliminans (strain LMG P-21439 / DCA1) TaxID=871963 RepID=L0F9J1_DESDL|nr:trigger factor [Desulfitobacterium dichloroeliminans]AGA70489.1 trigger factor [Desulfitobacterium dichloroeliminans LMG P-21439]